MGMRVIVGTGVEVGFGYRVGTGEFLGNGNVGVALGGATVADGAHGTINENMSSVMFLSNE